jgi:hypothetical protein
MTEAWVNLQTEPRPIGAVQTCCFFIALMDFCHLPRGRQTSPFQPEKPHSQLSKIVSGWADRELASPPKNIGGLLSAGRPWRIGGQLHGRTGFGGGNPGEVFTRWQHLGLVIEKLRLLRKPFFKTFLVKYSPPLTHGTALPS